MSIPEFSIRLIAFSDDQCVAEGSPEQVVTYLKSIYEKEPERNLLIFDVVTSRTIELDLRDSPATILATQFKPASATSDVPAEKKNAGEELKRGRGRPKLGVVSREVTLLPRHWDWLSNQPGGASVALRRLVDQARHHNGEKDKRRESQESAYRFMTVLAGNERGYEEAIRALYAGDLPKLQGIIENWPPDIARHAETLARTSMVSD